jgi:hypothetical protein
MTDLTLESLAARVNRLERQNRLLKALAIVAVAVLAAVVCMGQVRKAERLVVGEVRASSFVLQDGGGRMLAALGRDDNGAPQFALYAGDKGVARLGVGRNGLPDLAMSELGTKSLTVLGFGRPGRPSFTMWDAKGNTLFSAP